MGYADLHIHIKNNSDNKNGQSVEEILKEAIQNQTYTISLTSHNTLTQYTELFETIKRLKEENKELYNQVINNMKFVIGVEINSRINGKIAKDMLAYNIPIEKIGEVQEWLNNNTNKDVTVACQLEQLKHFQEAAERLNIPYNKEATIGEEQKYAGMVFATAVKNQIDEMLADILIKQNPISNIFKKLIENDGDIKEKVDNQNNRKSAYIEIFNDKNILEKIPQIEQIKQLYYQIIDLRLFASQNTETEKTVDQTVKELEETMRQEFESRNIEKLDDESLELINAELYSKFFEKDSEFFEVNNNLSSLKSESIPKEDSKRMKLALYYSIAEQIKECIKNDKNLKEELMQIQNALVYSKISFSDILERLNWFNSELVRPEDTPFSFNTAIFKPRLEDVIEEMHKVGAIVEVAHPYASYNDNVDEYINKCAQKNIDGIEALYSFAMETEEEYRKNKEHIQKFCKERNLISNTGGSDYHQKSSERIGILRCGIRINEDEIADEIKTIPAHIFIEQMHQFVDKDEISRD